MTLVNTATGEVLDVEAAEMRASFICTDLDHAADSFETAMERMRAAIRDRDDIALGYRSPGDYLSDRFGGRLARLGVDLRREVVRELTDAGLSTRAIAPVVGVSNKTVHQDREAGVTPGNTSVAEEEARGTTEREADDASAADQPEGASFPARTASPAADEGEPEASPARPPVIGIDGKSYSRPAPIDHRARAAQAVAEFPDLAYYQDRDPEHAWRLADTLRGFREPELSDRLATLRRSIAVDRAKRNGTYQPPAATGTPSCPACGQTVRN